MVRHNDPIFEAHLAFSPLALCDHPFVFAVGHEHLQNLERGLHFSLSSVLLLESLRDSALAQTE